MWPQPPRDESRLPPVPARLQGARTLEELRRRVVAAVLADGVVGSDELRLSLAPPPREFRLPPSWRAVAVASASHDVVGMVEAHRAQWRGLVAAGAIKDTSYLLGLTPVGAVLEEELTPSGVRMRGGGSVAAWPVELLPDAPPIKRLTRSELRRAYLDAARAIGAEAHVRTVTTLGVAIEIKLVVDHPRDWICGEASLPVKLDPYALSYGGYDGRFLVVRDHAGRLVRFGWYAARVERGAGGGTGPAYAAMAAACPSSSLPSVPVAPAETPTGP